MRLIRMISIGSVCLLTACATSENPREGGFFGGIQGLSSGTYERRISEREDNLARMREIQQELDQESARLDARKQQRQRVLSEEQRKLAALDSDVKSLERKLAAMRADESVSSKRVADLNQRLTQLKGGLSNQQSALDALEGGAASGADALEGTGSGGADSTRRKQLEKQRLALQQEYDELLNLTLMLAQ